MNKFEALRSGAIDWIQHEKPRVIRIGGLLGFEKLRYRQSNAELIPLIVMASESTHIFSRERTGQISAVDLETSDRAMVRWFQDDIFVQSPIIRSPDAMVHVRNLTGLQEELVHDFVAIALAQAVCRTSWI